MRRFRRSGAWLGAVLAAASVLVAGGGTAQASTETQVCAGTWAVTYDPPITNDLQLVHGVLTGFFPTCTDIQVFNASYVQVFDDVVSCTELLSAGSASRTFVWGNPLAAPSTSTYNWTSGRYAPGSAVQVATLVTPDTLACAGEGIASLTGPTTLTITNP